MCIKEKRESLNPRIVPEEASHPERHFLSLLCKSRLEKKASQKSEYPKQGNIIIGRRKQATLRVRFSVGLALL